MSGVKEAIILLMVTIICCSAVWADSADITEAQITNISRADLMTLTAMGVDIDSVMGNQARVYVSSVQLEELRQLGYQVSEISEAKHTRQTEGYHTVDELTAELQDTTIAYPNICRLYSIGVSVEGRNLWMIKLSDNPDISEDEPEIRFVSTMHGDEPVGMELSLYLIRFLTQSYGTDSRITSLVNETEIWVMPLMNPDGYVSLNRYNKQDKDLNRCFPDRVSAPRNSVAGRPPEVQAVMNWGFSHSPVLSASFHTGALLVNYSYDSDPNPYAVYSATPDDPLFVQLSLAYSSRNKPMYSSQYFANGIINGVQWYFVYGGMADWNYIWMGCFELTVELSDVKWPPISAIPALWENNREAMLYYTEMALKGVRGIVTDQQTGKPLDAAVRVAGIEHDVGTDPDVGDYHRILLPGTYSIRFSADGYVSRTVSGILVSSDTATRLDIALTPVQPQPGDINADGTIDITDAVAGLQAVTFDGGSSVYCSKAADADGDGKIGLPEILFVLQTVSAAR